MRLDGDGDAYSCQGFKPASMCRSDQLCVCVCVFCAACMMSSGSDGSVLGIMGALHHTRKIGKAIYYGCAKGGMTCEAVSRCSNQETNNVLTMQNKTGQFAKPQMSNHCLTAVNRPVKLWISPQAQTVSKGL